MWATPVIAAPIAAASPLSNVEISFLTEGLARTTTYAVDSCNPFTAWIGVWHDGTPAPVGTVVTVTLPTGVRWSPSATTESRELTTDASGRIALTDANSLKVVDASATVTLSATTPAVPGPAIAYATVTAAPATFGSTFRGRGGVGTDQGSATYASYVVDQAGNVYAHTAASSSFHEWTVAESTPVRTGQTLVAADDGLIASGGSRAARLFSSNGSVVYDWDNAQISGALPGSRTMVDLAVAYNPSTWTVTVVANDGTAWQRTRTIGSNWSSSWTQISGVTGARFVATDTQLTDVTTRIFATATQVFSVSNNGTPTVLVNAPAGRTIIDLSVEIGGGWINIIADNQQYYRTSRTNPGTWDSASITGNVTSVASSSTPNTGIRAFYVAGTSVCPVA